MKELIRSFLLAVCLLLGGTYSAWAGEQTVSWKAASTTSTAANTTLTDEVGLTATTVFATTLSSDSKTIDSESFTHYIQVRNAAYPTVDVPTGTEQSGSTSIVLSPTYDGVLTIYYMRQSTAQTDNKGTYASNDGKDLKVYNQSNASVLDGELTIYTESADGKNGWAKKVIELEANNTYTLSAKGTTIRFYGLKFTFSNEWTDTWSRTFDDDFGISEFTGDIELQNFSKTIATKVAGVFVGGGSKTIGYTFPSTSFTTSTSYSFSFDLALSSLNNNTSSRSELIFTSSKSTQLFKLKSAGANGNKNILVYIGESEDELSKDKTDAEYTANCLYASGTSGGSGTNKKPYASHWYKVTISADTENGTWVTFTPQFTQSGYGEISKKISDDVLFIGSLSSTIGQYYGCLWLDNFKLKQILPNDYVTTPSITLSGNTLFVASGVAADGSNVKSYGVKYSTSATPDTEGTELTEGNNTLGQGYYYIYSVSDNGNVSDPVYVEVVCRSKETYDFKTLYNNGSGYTTINNSGSGTYGYNITTLTNSSSEVGRYINGRLQFNYQNGNGNNWWFRSNYGDNTLFVSVKKSSNFAVKVSADDAVIFNGSNLSFIEESNIYGVNADDNVVNGKVYFAKEDGYVVIKGGSYAQLVSVVVNTDDEIFTTPSVSKAINGTDRVITITPGHTTSDYAVNTYYTTDGTTPTAESTVLESDEITISNDCTLKIVSINAITGNTSSILTTDVVCGLVTKTYDFSSTALTSEYGGTTISFDNTETALARINKLNYYQAYCGDGESKTAIENMTISNNGSLAYYSTKDGLYNSGGGWRSIAFTNAKKGQKFVFTTTDGSETAEITNISNATSQSIGTSANSWVFTVDNDGDVAFNIHRYSYVNKIEVLTSFVSVPCTTGFATYANHDYALDFSNVSGLIAYKASVSDNVVTFTPVGKVPAGTGLLLKGETADVPVVGSADDVDVNLLYAPTTAITGNSLSYDDGENYNYILAQPAGKQIGFYRANNSNIAVGKAYLRIPQSLEARQFSFIGFDENGSETTGIVSVNNRNIDKMQRIYDLQGRRIDGQLSKGLYIVNGKKVIVK